MDELKNFILSYLFKLNFLKAFLKILFSQRYSPMEGARVVFEKLGQ